MEYFIKDVSETMMPVYFNITKGNPGMDVNILIYSSSNTDFDPIAEIGCICTHHGYLVQILKMECELKTANKIIEFLNNKSNWKPQ